MCGQKVEYFNFKTGGTCSDHWALRCLMCIVGLRGWPALHVEYGKYSVCRNVSTLVSYQIRNTEETCIISNPEYRRNLYYIKSGIPKKPASYQIRNTEETCIISNPEYRRKLYHIKSGIPKKRFVYVGYWGVVKCRGVKIYIWSNPSASTRHKEQLPTATFYSLSFLFSFD